MQGNRKLGFDQWIPEGLMNTPYIESHNMQLLPIKCSVTNTAGIRMENRFLQLEWESEYDEWHCDTGFRQLCIEAVQHTWEKRLCFWSDIDPMSYRQKWMQLLSPVSSGILEFSAAGSPIKPFGHKRNLPCDTPDYQKQVWTDTLIYGLCWCEAFPWCS